VEITGGVARARARAALFADWLERLAVLSGVPISLRLPLVDVARLSFTTIDCTKLPVSHPLRGAFSASSKGMPEEAAEAFAAGTAWEGRLPALVRFARGLASIEMAESENGLPPLWPRVVLRFDGSVSVSPVSGPDGYRVREELAALVETSGLNIPITANVLDPLSHVKAGTEVAVVAHFDPHGLTAMIPTVRTLRESGLASRIVSSYDTTGDYARLWKRIIKELYEKPDIGALVLLDLSIDSRNPDRCFEFAAKANAGEKPILWIDHHRDTLLAASKLAGPKVTLHLTGVLGTHLAQSLPMREIELLTVGAVSDKDPYAMWAAKLWRESGKMKDLFLILNGVESALDSVTPPPRQLRKILRKQSLDLFSSVKDRIMRLDREYLIELGKKAKESPLTLADVSSPPAALIEENPELAEYWNSHSGAWGLYPGAAVEGLEPLFEPMGRIIVFTKRPPGAGRFWYEIMEDAMSSFGKYGNGLLRTPYAVATRILENGKANVLFLTHHEANSAPDIRLFLPQSYQTRWIGHPRAFWLDVRQGSEKRLINLVVKRVNAFMEAVFPDGGDGKNNIRSRQ
jgi:hypothetical protein